MPDTKICFVSDTIHTYFGSTNTKGAGGAERQQYMLIREFVKKSYDISVATLATGDDVTSDGVTIYQCIPDIRGFTGAPYKLASVVRSLRSINADIYYVRGNHFLAVATAIACRLSSKSFVYAVANDSDIEPDYWKERNWILKNLYFWALKSANTITTLTQFQRDVLESEYQLDADVIPCGYSLPESGDIIPHDEREFVLWVGRMDPVQKMPTRFVELARRCPDQQFIMIGPPDNDRPEHADEIQSQAGEVDNLEYIGFVEPSEIHEYFRRASLLVSTSDFEGFGNVFLEAWRYETPVVSLNYTLDGVISKQPVGKYADGSMDKLVSIVQQLAPRVADRAKLGKNGRDLVATDYSLNTIVQEYDRIFSDLSGDKN